MKPKTTSQSSRTSEPVPQAPTDSMWEDPMYLYHRLVIFLTGVQGCLQGVIPELLRLVQDGPVKQWISEISDQEFAAMRPWLRETQDKYLRERPKPKKYSKAWESWRGLTSAGPAARHYLICFDDLEILQALWAEASWYDSVTNQLIMLARKAIQEYPRFPDRVARPQDPDKEEVDPKI